MTILILNQVLKVSKGFENRPMEVLPRKALLHWLFSTITYALGGEIFHTMTTGPEMLQAATEMQSQMASDLAI
jgi:hypothetical protein